MANAEEQLNSFAAKYTPEIAERGLAAIALLHRRLPTAARIVYDNYNALAVGFGPDERASHVILSIAFYPRWISLFFMQAAGLDDPAQQLRGSGKVVRHIVLDSPEDLDNPAIEQLIDQALANAVVPLSGAGKGALIIKSISAKQRLRRP